MSSSGITSQAIRDVLTRFGALRPRLPTGWTGDVPLHPSLTRFFDKAGPLRRDRLNEADISVLAEQPPP